MEIKAELQKPFEEQERMDFIIEYNHNQGLVIEETGEALIAWGYTDEEIAQIERERIAKLYLTGADVERGIYQATGMDFDDVVGFIESQPESTLDIKAIKIELKANHFYRGNPYVNAVGTLLGFTSEQLDKFFEYNDYTYLLPVEEPDQVEENLDMVEPEEPHTLEDESNVDNQ